ncbi:MAG: PQQ-binding-like beta-propeller repeat protein [Candidatus Nealsonbacteria bacterium]|nr:PQQ-binding-like beta-propeller repeat protein [Candidatus Nealsonbacteria bacterium]
MHSQPFALRLLAAGLAVALIATTTARAADRPQWGEQYSRNMVSAEKGLPASFDPDSGRNVKWSVPLGSECYSTPVIADGKVLIGTNNNEPRDPRHDGDRGVMMCFNEADGKLVWQLVVPKLSADIFFDWPRAGMCSPATVEGDRVYTVTNRDEVVCLDLNGLADGNDGPFRDEGRHTAPQDQPAMKPGPLDADILWVLDLRTAAGVRPHDSAHSSILLDGQFLYVNTSNGLTSKHDGVDKPNAPSLVAVDKATGRLVAREREGISTRIFHSTWSSPALAEVDGRRLVLFAGGDGVVYAFDALKPAESAESLKCVWRFDCDPTAPKKDIHSYVRNRRESPSNIKSMPVFHDGRVYVTYGGDIWWGKNKAWMKCFDASGTGDITETALRWTYPVEQHCCSTPSVHDGLVYTADCGGKVHCVDAATGRACWVHDAGRDMWASTLVADGKVYIGTRSGQFWVLAAGRKKQVLSTVRLDAAVISTPVAANGTLYVGTMKRLYALREGEAGRE